MMRSAHPYKIFLAASVITLLTAHGAAAEDAAWASDLTDAANSQLDDPYGDAMYVDPQFRLAQAAAPADNDQPAPTRTASRAARTSRVPFMIGDQSVGLSGALAVTGIDAIIEHPIFGGNRFNVAENGSVLPTDRVYVTYRHLNSAYDRSLVGFNDSSDVERFDLGAERTALDGLVSAEIRVPILRQIDPSLDLYLDNLGNTNLPLSDRHGQLGNLAVNFKVLLLDRQSFALTGGVAVNCPTGENAFIRQNYDEFDVPLVTSPFVSTVTPSNIALSGRFDNDTVNLVPYVAWVARPGRFFHQGFFQVDAPLNRSDASVVVEGTITPSSDLGASTFAESARGKFAQQTLLRLNLGFGYWLTENRPGLIEGIAGLFEVHYTATVSNPDPFVVPAGRLLSTNPNIDDIPIDVVAGPFNNINQVNLTAGFAANIGSWQVTNAVGVPVTNETNRAFDFEYTLQANRRF